jgi:hypothetical protein
MSHADEHYDRAEWRMGRSPNLNKIMVVEFNTGGANYIPVRQTAVRRANTTPADDSPVSFSTSSLQQSLKDLPQVRADKVAQASALVNDSSYPSDTALNQLAGFFANRL